MAAETRTFACLVAVLAVVAACCLVPLAEAVRAPRRVASHANDGPPAPPVLPEVFTADFFETQYYYIHSFHNEVRSNATPRGASRAAGPLAIRRTGPTY